MLALVFVVGGCGAVDDNEAYASISSGFTIVSATDLFDEDLWATELKHDVTGCHYTVTVDEYNYLGSSIEPMYVKENGVTVPYCD